MAAKAGFLRRVRDALLWAAVAFVAGSVLSVLAMRWVPPVTSAFMLGSVVAAWRSGDLDYRVDYRWTPYARISRHAKLAVIAAEDQKFAFHPGFDFESIDEAIRDRERGKRLRGASTISQQVAKNLFLWKGQNFVRKGLEAWFTLWIELLWPKRRILEVYLNVAEFGPGIYGVGAAAPRFFRKEPARLSRGEAALLAAVLPNPRRFRVQRPSAYVLGRQAWIVGQMNALGGAAYIREVERN
ncbi:MAG: monofunctional biosynthetic peptidoglycan transglycosylase [Steroidobacteraceae bacterium]|nr:monofunctional biosynthetic peptidoglycan transglycosylase [Steroidobacteraceae bacterium]